MAIIRKSELAKMSAQDLEAKVFEIRRELNTERGLASSGGRSQNPGKIRELRRTVARILMLLQNKKDFSTGGKKAAVAPAAQKEAAGKGPRGEN